MDKNRVKKDGRVWELKEVNIKIAYLNPNYTINPHSHNKLSEHGLLTIAELIPNNLALPKFVFRWDDKNEAMDVDLYVDREINNDLWKDKRYEGHHTKRLTSEKGRIYEVKIKSPLGRIFEGLMRVPVIMALDWEETITFKVDLVEKFESYEAPS